MAYTPFKNRLRAAAIAYAGLSPVIGTQWFDVQLPQTAQLPPSGSVGAVTVQQISGPRLYTNTARLATYWGRFQFTIWGGQFDAGAQLRDQIFLALGNFLDVTSFDGIAGRSRAPNGIVGDRDALFTMTDGPVYQKIVDAMLWINESL